ncbi:MAG: alpha-glucuronidase [Proteiniphilum sp.]|jgi:alpha-glucuronidase|uniref:alpha-glucuronidase n=1 Tax=Proteiniphilum sp. TaxID=1926877 RepID=UPI002B206049|nr:alpha-glucuronidase [Proteiniphilum sp.]MEA5127137.1 alpha-glucuronidase [Proteiniphilum sp.]
MNRTVLYIILLFWFSAGYLKAEDGSRLWLRAETTATAQVKTNRKSPTITIAVEELKTQWKGAPVQLVLKRDKELLGLKKDGYIISGDKQKGVTVRSVSDIGLLYGAYHLLRLQETQNGSDRLQITESPKYDLRLLNHWDNLNGTIERGYAGHSIWKWNELPEKISPRYKEYARANASIGINGTVLNNVNASPAILTSDYLQKVKVVADILRPYGIKVYLSVNFSSPKILGGLPGSDPLESTVQQWWRDKAGEIYRLIPDFGGFLVKANSEGQPGPQDYDRTHADGANILADALRPYGGIVMWRAFVYNPGNEDRAKQAYGEFMPVDGKFRENVIVQVKNGPVDFQPREPFSPLFGGMEHTALMPELQVTQEYLGFSNHLVFLAPQWKEFFDSDTYCKGEGATVAKTTDGTIFPHSLSAIAGVANIGQDINWCGHHFAQANWYAFGRLAWNHELTADEIAEEWLRMTFTQQNGFITPVKQMMLDSWETAVNYMMPLGLHHIFAWGHHYGPEPWSDIPGARPDWLPRYYHNADEKGIGFDRTIHGSGAVSQYHSPLREQLNGIETCPEDLLLWFHHVPWDYRMKNGRTLWDELCYRYDTGVQQVREFQKIWDRMEGYIDEERFRHVQSRLKIQSRDAVWWKDACLLYFQTYSGKPIPYDIERPVHELDNLKKIKLDMKHHN